MRNSVDTVEAKRNAASVQSAIEDWLDDPDNPDEYGRTYAIKRGENRLVIVIEYTEE